MSRHKNENYLEYCVLAIVVIISFALRVITSQRMGWLADDVYHVVYINEWFLDHFKEYFFQWTHVNYPPKSPNFGNPPLSMWFMTFGMYIAKLINVPVLTGARLVNVTFGSFTIILTYIIGRRWFGGKYVAIIASMFLGFSPVVIASDSSAYLDTILSFFLMLDIYILFNYLDATTKKDKILLSILLGISLGFSLLTKLYIVPIIGIIFIMLLFKYLVDRKNLISYIIILCSTFLIPPLIWAGARDLGHLQKVFGFISSMNRGGYVGMFGGYKGVPGIGEESVFYYFWMLWGRLPPLLSTIFIFAILYGIYRLYSEILSKNINLSTIRFNSLILMIIVSVLFIHFGSMIRTTIHRVIFIVPLIVLLSSETLMMLYMLTIPRCMKYIENKNIIYIPLIFFVIFSLGVSITEWSPKFYNAYNNFLVGGLEGGNKIYRVGDGDGLELVGDWIMTNTVQNATVAVYNFAPTLQQYVKDRKVIGIPLICDVNCTISKGARYLVVNNYVANGPVMPLHNFSNVDPVFTVRIKGYPYIIVYDVSPP